MSYNTTIIEKIFRGHTMAVFANPPLPPLNGPLCGLGGWVLLPVLKDVRKEDKTDGKSDFCKSMIR